MAEFGVNIDTVYQTVQALANKEQRGYITPQEFNLFANQAQLDIFEQYFYDLNAFRKQNPEYGNTIGDSISMIKGKLQPWTREAALTTTGNLPTSSVPGLRVGRIFRGSGITQKTPIPMEPEEYQDLRNSAWHKEGFTEVVTWGDSLGGATGSEKRYLATGNGLTTGTVEYVKGRPALVYWGYVIVNEKPTYDPERSAHFTLHSSEQPDIIIKVLELAGISIENPQLMGVASQEEQQNIADERI